MSAAALPDPRPLGPLLDGHHVTFAATIGGWAAATIGSLPAAEDDGTARRQARELLARLGDGGWLRPLLTERDGGTAQGPDLRSACLAREALAAASPLADAVFALQGLGSMPLTIAGTEAQRGRWLPGVARGEVMTAFAMTEEEAGTDVAGLATRAVRDGDGWRLDGAKTFISNAGIADLYTVFAATDPEAGHRGLSAFLVPADAPGLVFEGPQVLSSPHPLGRIAFRELRLPADALLGEPGGGFKLGMRTLDRLRPTVAAAACGMAARALAEALVWAKERRQFGQRLADFQLVREKLARMATDLAAARLLVYRAAWEGDTGGSAGTATAAMAKAFATEAAQRIVDEAVQLLGGRGCLADHPVDRLYRSVRALRIYEGTTEIQRLVVARELLRE